MESNREQRCSMHYAIILTGCDRTPKLVWRHGNMCACTVLLNGKTDYSCLVLAVDATNKKITTVEVWLA